MVSAHSSLRIAFLAAGALALAACGGSENKDGVLTVKITDSPIDNATAVVVVFTGVELKPADGEPFSIDYCGPADLPANCQKAIDLLQLQDGVTDTLLEDEEVPVGQYQWMRLKVRADRNLSGASYIRLDDGTEYPLFVPSGAQTGLKIVRPFVVAQGGTTRLVIDFDIRKSVIAPPGLAPNYLLKPTLRMVDELQTGTITGEVDLAALAAEQGLGTEQTCQGGVYLFAGAGATPDDMDGGIDGDDPVVYRILEPEVAEGDNAPYMFSFVEAGAYTIAFTCNFDVDASPEESEYNPDAAEGEPGYQSMNWTAFDVVLGAGETVVVDFPTL
jgi:hypothetical protein